MSGQQYHLVRMKEALKILSESIESLLSESVCLAPRSRPMLKRIEDFYNIKELPDIVGIRRSSIYRKISKNSFPKPVSLSDNRVAWRKSDIQHYLDNLKRRKFKK